MDEVIQAATVITALLHLLSILHCSGKVYSELFGYAINAIQVFAVNIFLLVSAFFLQVCHPCRGDCGWLTAFELLQGKDSLLPGACWCWLWAGGGYTPSFLFLFLACHSEKIGIHLLITTCIEVWHHCFKLLRQPTIEVVTLQFGNVIWWKAFWEWSHKNLGVPLQMQLPLWHSLYPFTVGRALGSRHLVPWHCCNFHPAWWVCHLKWHLSLSFLPTPWDSPVGSR